MFVLLICCCTSDYQEKFGVTLMRAELNVNKALSMNGGLGLGH